MRRFTMAVAIAATTAVVLPASAMAESIQDFDLTASPAKSSTAKKKIPVKVKFTTGTRETTPGVQPKTTSKAVVYFPGGAVWNGDLFPKCSGAAIAAAKSTDDCPSGSIVGTGRAEAIAPGPITQKDPKITAVNGGKKQVNLFVEGSSPLRIQSNLAVAISNASAPYGIKLSVDIPQNLREPAPGVKTAFTLFTVTVNKTIKVKGVKRGIAEINKCTGTWQAKADWYFDDGEIQRPTDSLKCTKG